MEKSQVSIIRNFRVKVDPIEKFLDNKQQIEWNKVAVQKYAILLNQTFSFSNQKSSKLTPKIEKITISYQKYQPIELTIEYESKKTSKKSSILSKALFRKKFFINKYRLSLIIGLVGFMGLGFSFLPFPTNLMTLASIPIIIEQVRIMKNEFTLS